MHNFYAFLNRMKLIKRWALMRSLNEENIAEHSQQVAIIAHALAVIKNKYYGGEINIGEVVLLAQYHEVQEVIVGDLPTPVKYFNSEIKTAYKKLEDLASIRLLNMLPKDFYSEYEKYIRADNTTKEYSIVKAADKLSAYLKCVEEVKSGNNEFKHAKNVIEKELKNLSMPEVDYFLKHFAPPFSLSLDELE